MALVEIQINMVAMQFMGTAAGRMACAGHSHQIVAKDGEFKIFPILPAYTSHLSTIMEMIFT